MSYCIDAPVHPADGEKFTCPACGHTATYIVLDGKGEWV